MARNAALSSLLSNLLRLLSLPVVVSSLLFSSSALSAETDVKHPLLAKYRSAVGTSSAALAAVTEKPSRFGLGAWSYTNVNVKSMDEDNADVQQFSRVTAIYNFNGTQSVGWLQEFWYKFATSDSASGSGHEGHGILDDGGFQYVDSKLAMLPFDWKLGFLFRQYLPIGEKSRFVTGRKGYEQAALTFSKTIGSIELAEYIYGTYFNQTQDFYYNSSAEIVANPDYEFDQYFYVGWNLTPYFTLVNWLGSEHIWKRGVPEKGVSRHNDFYNETGFCIKPSKQLAISGTVLTDAPVDSQIPFTPYSSAYTFYRLYLTLSI